MRDYGLSSTPMPSVVHALLVTAVVGWCTSHGRVRGCGCVYLTHLAALGGVFACTSLTWPVLAGVLRKCFEKKCHLIFHISFVRCGGVGWRVGGSFFSLLFFFSLSNSPEIEHKFV